MAIRLNYGKNSRGWLFSIWRLLCKSCSCTTKKNPFWFDTLIDKLYKANAEDISVVENFEIEDFNTEDIIDEAEDTITILSKYVNSLEVENKKELDSLMKSLYTESLTVETL